jgi:hypothetical protein
MKMKKLIIGMMFMFSLVSATEVTVCSGFVTGATKQLNCTGNYIGKASIVDLYKKGWHYIGDIGGSTILVFEK